MNSQQKLHEAHLDAMAELHDLAGRKVDVGWAVDEIERVREEIYYQRKACARKIANARDLDKLREATAAVVQWEEDLEPRYADHVLSGLIQNLRIAAGIKSPPADETGVDAPAAIR